MASKHLTLKGNRRHLAVLATLLVGCGVTGVSWVAAQSASSEASDRSYWFAPGTSGDAPALARYHDGWGQIEVLNVKGPIESKGNAFFEPIGTNGRACITCHQPASGMGLSVETIQRRWRETQGKDPLFAAIDGANCPSLPQADPASHSLLLKRGLFRVSLPWPRHAGPDGSPVDPEFTVEVVRDPTGCNTSPVYGLQSADPHISVYRRPRVVGNLKYVSIDAGGTSYAGTGPFNAKRLGMVSDKDPETGKFSSMNIMSDAREPTLKTQAISAAHDHLEARARPTEEQLRQIVSFESQVFVGQGVDKVGDDFGAADAPPALGAKNLALSATGVLGDNFGKQVFKTFDVWPSKSDSLTASDEFKASVKRGYAVFFTRPFWIRDVTHINTVGLGNPVKRTCVTCHNLQMIGTDASAGWVDLGTTNEPWAGEPLFSPNSDVTPDLPLFKVICNKDARPHPFLGRVIYTHDPGRALISGKCYDVGSIVMGQLRALSARAPFFSNGSAEDLRALVDFYDRRFNMSLTQREKEDLTNFLSVL